MFGRAVSGWTTMKRPARSLWSARSRCALLVALSALLLVACGGERLDVNEPRATFTVDLPTKSFPTSQTLSESTHLVLAIRNDSNKTIPDIAVTICNVTCTFPANGQPVPGEGTSIQPFAECVGPPGPRSKPAGCLQAAGWSPSPGNGAAVKRVANLSRQVWIIDKPPDPANCKGRAGYSCAGGSFGGAPTYDSNTWGLGPLKPGATKTFDWGLTAVMPGHHIVAWEVSAGLSGKAKAVLSDGSTPRGAFSVMIKATPQNTYVNNAGQIKTGTTAGG
jgi:hypothetical protein